MVELVEKHGPITVSPAVWRLRLPWPSVLGAYAVLHGVCLVLYAFLGKGFAYVGWGFFYAGEFLMLCAIPTAIATRRIAALAKTPLGIVLLCFLGWQAACTLPYLDEYGIDALRDGVLWAYAVFAWASAALVLRLSGLLPAMVSRFRLFSNWYLFIGPLAFVATHYFGDSLPHWSETSVSIPLVKGGELCAHLAGILAFCLAVASVGKR